MKNVSLLNRIRIQPSSEAMIQVGKEMSGRSYHRSQHQIWTQITVVIWNPIVENLKNCLSEEIEQGE